MKLKLLRLLAMTIKLSTYGIITQVIFMTMLHAYDGSAQYKSTSETIINESVSGLSVKETFDLIEANSEFQMFYLEKDLDEKVTINLKSTSQSSVFDILMEVSKKAGLKFKQVNNGISASPIRKQDLKKRTPVIQIMADVDIKGKVSDENGQGLPGASVIVKETSNGVTTDLEGNYKISVPEESVLTISFVGYKTQEVSIAGRSEINVQMEPDAEQLEEVVVVGYGTQKKKDVTGSVVQVGSEDFLKGANTNAFQLLNGKASGVHVSQSSNAPGGSMEIKIRGANSVNGGNGVLVVVDGLPNGNVDALSPDDIESIQILKDASASAIYGSRAANGVVLITTKQGNKQGLDVSYNTYVGFQNAAKRIDMLTGKEYRETINDLLLAADPGNVPLYSDAQIAEVDDSFNWQDQVFRSGLVHNHQISMSSGNEKTTFYASLNYLNNKGTVRRTGETRYNARLNVSVNPIKKLSVKFNLNVNRSEVDLVPLGRGSINSVIGSALGFDPSLDAELNDQGRYKLNPFIQVENPEANLQGFDQHRVRNEILGNARIEYEIFEGFKASLNLGTRISATKFDSYQNRLTQAGLSTGGQAEVRNNDNSYGLAEYLLSYERVVGDHSFKIMGGITYEKFINRRLEGNAEGFLADTNGSNFFGAANPTRYVIETDRFEPALRSQLGRFTYSFQDKYLLTASVRADGTAKFSDKNKTAIFPSASLGWQIAAEPFMQDQNLIGDLKLRLGYGEIGNQAIGNFETKSTFEVNEDAQAVLGNQVLNGAVPARLPNPNLIWETTKEVNVGLDFALMDFRLSGSIEYYVRNTSDQLFNRPVPRSTGFASFRQNFGNVRNKGVDITLSSKNIVQDDFTWETDLTLSFLKNEVTEVPDFVGNQVTGGAGFAFVGDVWVVRPGEPMNAYFGYQIDGIYSTQAEIDEANANLTNARAGFGHPIVRDVNGDGDINPDDRVILGKPFADYTFGLNNRVSYKNFTLDFYLIGVQGIDAFNFLINESFYPIDPDRNKLAYYYNNRWTPENPGAEFPSMVEPGNYSDGRKVNKWTVQDASFIRLKNVTLGYDVPVKSSGLKAANVFVSFENFLTITDYDGFDPDANASGSGSARTVRGTFGDYPLSKTIRLGAKVTF
ncbi:MAG: TonB-dependent receptor [Cyclobacteriaceae bacterium]